MKKKLWAIVAAVTMLFGACTPPGGTVAVVSGKEIREADLQEVIDSCQRNNIFPAGRGYATFLREYVVGSRIASMKNDPLLQNMPDDEQLKEALRQNPRLSGINDPVCRDFVLDQMRFTLLENFLAQKTPKESSADLNRVLRGIELNPRYGELVVNGRKIAVGSSSLSTKLPD